MHRIHNIVKFTAQKLYAMDQNSTIDIGQINEKIERESAFVDLLTGEMNKVIVGQKYMVERLLIGLLGQGHILLEGVPGLAKPSLLIHFPRLYMEVLVEFSLHQICYQRM